MKLIKKHKIKNIIGLSSMALLILCSTACGSSKNTTTWIPTTAANTDNILINYSDENSVMNTLNDYCHHQLKSWFGIEVANKNPRLFANANAKNLGNMNFFRVNSAMRQQYHLNSSVKYWVDWSKWTIFKSPLKMKIKDAYFKNDGSSDGWEWQMVDFKKLNINHPNDIKVYEKSIIHQEIVQKMHEFQNALSDFENQCHNEVAIQYNYTITNDSTHNPSYNPGDGPEIQEFVIISNVINFDNPYYNGFDYIAQYNYLRTKNYYLLNNVVSTDINSYALETNDKDRYKNLMQSFLNEFDPVNFHNIKDYVDLEIKDTNSADLSKIYNINYHNPDIKYIITLTDKVIYNKKYTRDNEKEWNVKTLLMRFRPLYGWKSDFIKYNNVNNFQNDNLFKSVANLDNIIISDWYSIMSVNRVFRDLAKHSIFLVQQGQGIGWAHDKNNKNLYSNDHAISWSEQLLFSLCGKNNDFQKKTITQVNRFHMTKPW